MIFAAIDIGSNAGRLLIANVFEKNGKIITDKATLVRIPLRLGMDVFEKKMLSDLKVSYLINTLKAYKLLIDVYQPIDYMACATSAMREASNGPEVIKRIKEEIGFDLQIIDGLKEAEIVATANESAFQLEHPNSIYVDVGGGSTEISIFNGSKFVDAASFKIGTIRLLNKLTKESEWDRMHIWLNQYQDLFQSINCIGSGGNINKLTKLYGNRLTNIISFEELTKGYQKLTSLKLEERISKMGLRPDRADVIVPAAEIFLDVMKVSGITEVFAPKFGLADGLTIQLYKKHQKRENQKNQ